MLYLDTSLVVALITAEPYTEQAQDWLRAQTAGDPTISDWVTTEVASALSLKERAGTLSAADRDRAEETYRMLQQDVFEVVEVRPLAFTQAAAFAGRAELSLRSGDALHLAIAAENRARLCTRDRTQALAGRQLGLDVFLLGAEPHA